MAVDLPQLVAELEARFAAFERDCGGSAIGPTERWQKCCGVHAALLRAVKDALVSAYPKGGSMPDAQLSRRLVVLRDQLVGLEPLYLPQV
jgi:hypothetical protein